jgi:membrane-associated phospholipid phosphatase
MSGSEAVSQSHYLGVDPGEVVYIPPARSAKIARWVSDYLSPPVLVAASLIMVAVFAGTALVWVSIGVFMVLAIGLPTLYVFWLVKRKMVSDFHIPIRRQRIRPMIFMLGSSLVSVFFLSLLHPPRFLMMLALAAMAQLSVIFLITLKWKISGHTAAVSTFSALCWFLFGSLAGFVFILVPIVIWARLRLKRHTPMQTLAGTVLGLLTLVGILFIV